MNIKKTTLPNGIRVVHEYIDTVRSVALGVWVGSGSRYESENLSGISHFIEHMIFKGTPTRSAQDIARQMDAMGGLSNAYTSKEVTCYYLRVLDTHLEAASDILADMVLHSKFDDEDLKLERSVVLEEIDMYEDTPEDVASEKLFQGCFADSALGRPVLGSKEALNRMSGETLRDYIRNNYHTEDIVVALSGHYTMQDLEHICTLFSEMQGSGHSEITPAAYQPCMVLCPKEIEQNHLCLGFPGLAMLDKRRYAYRLMSAILGDGMSSRLFQTVREKNGLCYSVYSYAQSFAETGLYSIYVGLNREQEEKALHLVHQVVEQFCAEGPTEEELNRYREQIKSTMLMGLESTSARMNHLGKFELATGNVPDIDELIRNYDLVTAAEVRDLAREIFDWSKVSLCAVGNTGNEAYYRALLG